MRHLKAILAAILVSGLISCPTLDHPLWFLLAFSAVFALLAIFYCGGLCDHRCGPMPLAFRPNWLLALLRALRLLLAAYGGLLAIFLTGMVLTPSGDPFSMLLIAVPLSIAACVSYGLGRRKALGRPANDTGVSVSRPFQLALVLFACLISLLSLFLAAAAQQWLDILLVQLPVLLVGMVVLFLFRPRRARSANY